MYMGEKSSMMVEKCQKNIIRSKMEMYCSVDNVILRVCVSFFFGEKRKKLPPPLIPLGSKKKGKNRGKFHLHIKLIF